MAPPRNAREGSVEETDEYTEFIQKLRAFHERRGTNFDPAPRVGNHRIDWLRLYKRVVNDGGYDVVSNTRMQKLAWRNLGQDFHLGTTNLPLLAFQLKTVYYKNLAAYEIVDFHGKVPPPKEILEDVSAAGGDLLNRTLENYSKPQNRDVRITNGPDPDGSDEDVQRTPKEDRMEVDEAGNTSGRRGLRQAPPQRVIFQPDTSSSRQVRQPVANQQSSPTPIAMQYNSTHSLNGMNGYSTAYTPQVVPQSLANYEPKQQFPLTLRPVSTPANNPEVFKALQGQNKDLTQSKYGKASKAMMLPGTGFTGPNIYSRTLLALQSGIPEEQEYALHHLVKISHERGDKYRFDQFAGLAESLMEKILEVGSLFSRVEWKIAYDYTASTANPDTLDGLSGTLDILERINSLNPIRIQDSMQSLHFSCRLALINEAGLVVRNMIMLEENAEYLSRNPFFKDVLTILVTLPNDPYFVELKQYGFEMAEQMTKYYPTLPDDPLLKSLKGAIDSADRAIILASLRAVSRMGTHLEHVLPLQEVAPYILSRVADWLLVEDQELIGACLVFLYRYTSYVNNVDDLFVCADMESLVKLIARALMHGARTIELKLAPSNTVNTLPISQPPQTPEGETPIPRIPMDLIEQLLGYDEPERSSQWLRTCFEEEPNGEITQIALWQAYQIPFVPYGGQRPLLPAKDFITNVSTTFARASAQVINGPVLRFVIKGIRPRAAPVDSRGRTYMRCLWHLDNDTECGEFALAAKQMWEHIITTHLNLLKRADGMYHFTDESSRLYSCRWAGCQRFTSALDSVSPFAVGMHVKTHLPDSSAMAYQRSKHNVSVAEPETRFQQVQPALTSTSVGSNDFIANGIGGPTPPATPSAYSPTGVQSAVMSTSQQAIVTSSQSQAPTSTWPLYNTITDERNDAAGLPLTAALVLRNLARNIPRTDAAAREDANLASRSHTPARTRNSVDSNMMLDGGTPFLVNHGEVNDTVSGADIASEGLQEEVTGGDVLLRRVFSSIRNQLFYVMAHNQPLREYLAPVVKAILKGGIEGDEVVASEMD